MKIQVGGLSEGVHQFRFSAEGRDLEIGPEFGSTVVVETTLEKTGNQIFLRALLQTEGTFACDRCLTLFTKPVAANYRMYYLFEAADAERFDPSEVQLLSHASSIINVTEDVRQTLLVSVPLKLLCTDTCRGLCPTCGRNWNVEACSCHDEVVDSRWEELKKIRNEN